jgi:hypothetical protein
MSFESRVLSLDLAPTQNSKLPPSVFLGFYFEK